MEVKRGSERTIEYLRHRHGRIPILLSIIDRMRLLVEHVAPLPGNSRHGEVGIGLVCLSIRRSRERN